MIGYQSGTLVTQLWFIRNWFVIGFQMDGTMVGTSGSHNASSTLWFVEKSRILWCIAYWKYFQLGKFADLKHTNCGAVFRNSTTVQASLPTPYTYRLAVCQQVPTEMDRKKKTPTHSSSLFNEFESNSPFFSLFLFFSF
jgi:hypothetical protein